MYYVYLLKSLSSGVYYVGMAKDIQMWLKEYNSGKSRNTKGHQPFELVYQEGSFVTDEAREREKYLKRSDVKQRIISKLNWGVPCLSQRQCRQGFPPSPQHFKSP